MAKKLTKKQTELLSQFSHEALLDLMHTLLENNSEAHEYVVTQYLMSPEEKLKNIEREYKKQQRKKGNYDYYKSHEFFMVLEKSIADPLNELAKMLPAEVVKLSTTLLEDFEELSEKYDTSSGSWDDYLYGILTAWIKALGAAFKKDPTFDIASPYFEMQALCEYFPRDLLLNNKAHIPHEAIRAIRDAALEHQNSAEALSLSFVLKDYEYLNQHYQTNRFNQNKEACLAYAQILLDDFKTEEAVAALQELQQDLIPHYIQEKADTLLVDALYENGDVQEALKLCKHFFRKVLNVEYCKKYIKYHPATQEADTQAFYQMAYDRGSSFYIRFVAQMQNWAAFDEFVIDKLIHNDETWFDQLPDFESISNIRKWSTILAQQGFPITATAIRRELVELTLWYGKSTYYKYAISDLKKSMDYLDMVKDDSQKIIPSPLVYIGKLHAHHGRKYTFWQGCIDVIPYEVLKNYL